MSVPLYPLEAWMDNVALAGLCSKETLWATYELACSVITRGIPGDFVECGVYGGANSAVMARAVCEYNQHSYGFWDGLDRPQRYIKTWVERRVHLFDTFAGIPQAGPEDKEFMDAGHQEGLSMCSLESVKAHMKEWSLPEELFVYHQGLFKYMIPSATMGPWEIESIALLRLDGDLYGSTKDALELLPLVSPGGWVIVDDFNLSGCRQAVMESSLRGMPAYFNMQRKP